MDISFLLGGSVVAVLLIQVIKDITGKMEGKLGRLWTQVIVLCVSFAVAGVGVWVGKFPPFVLEVTGVVFTTTIAIYEVLFKALWGDKK